MADLQALKSRVRMLNKDEQKIQMKIKQTNILANKLAGAKQAQADRFQSIKQMNRERTLQTLTQSITIEQERQRHRKALEKARRDKELAVITGSMAIKETKRQNKEIIQKENEKRM